MLYLEQLDRFPAARRELAMAVDMAHRVAKEYKTKLPLFIDISAKTFKQILAVDLGEATEMLSRLFADEIGKICPPL